jgi:MscS family membrane protein
MGLFINSESKLFLFLEKINQTLVTIFIFWLLHQSLVPLSQAFQKFEQLLSKALILWLIRSLKYLIVFLGSVAVLETWGIKIGPVIAGLGLFGVAVALGAQDLFKNLISGIMIILERRFELNDVIEVPGHATGIVEHIGFRSTLIRQFDSTPISIPNYVFSDTSIVNFSDRKYRRIQWTIGLTYETTIKQLKDICHSINTSICSNNDFIVNDNYQLFVRVEKFNDSSIDVFISTFTNTNEWNKYLKIREELAFSIKDIVEKNDSSFAFPSQSIYIEKDNRN